MSQDKPKPKTKEKKNVLPAGTSNKTKNSVTNTGSKNQPGPSKLAAQNVNASSSKLRQSPNVAQEPMLDPPSMLGKFQTNTVGELQEYCGQKKLSAPSYSDIEWKGPDNGIRYTVTCTVGNHSQSGVAISKMNAKKIAAYKVLQEVRVSPTLALSSSSSSATSPTKQKSPKNVNPPSLPKQSATLQPSTLTTNDRPVLQILPKIIFQYNDKLAEIGGGAFGKVYEGYFEVPTVKAAIKVCQKSDEKSKEVEILRNLKDPNIVHYFITESVGDITYIVMELATTTLENIIKKKKHPDPKQLQKWATQMTKGLAALHGEKIVHRDLKPSNILICNNKIAKLADFGISRQLQSATHGVTTDAHGTIIWMATEAHIALGSSPPVKFKLKTTFDIFSLGLTIVFTMTGGKYLFCSSGGSGKGTNMVDVQSNIYNYKPNWEVLGGVEYTALKNLTEAMIHKDPIKRPNCSILLEHPFYWDAKHSLDFVEAYTNDLKSNSSIASECNTELPKIHTRFCLNPKISSSWTTRLCIHVQGYIQFRKELKGAPNSLENKKYKENSFLKLVDFIRDNHTHYKAWNSDYKDGILKGQDIFGKDGCNYGEYFFTKFPELITILYTFFQERKYRGWQLGSYYENNKHESFPKF